MDSETRETFAELLVALEAMRDSWKAQSRINDLVQSQLDSLGSRQDAFSAALRALTAEAQDVADSVVGYRIKKVD